MMWIVVIGVMDAVVVVFSGWSGQWIGDSRRVEDGIPDWIVAHRNGTVGKLRGMLSSRHRNKHKPREHVWSNDAHLACIQGNY